MDENEIQGAPRGSSGCGKALAIGCGSLLVILIIIAGVLWFNWHKIVAGVFRALVDQTLEQSNLPDEEEERIRGSIERVLSRLEKKELTKEQVGKLMEEVADSPVSRVFVVLSLKGAHLDSSGLSEEEKQDAERNVNRIVRGIMEGAISDADLESLGQKIPRKEGNPEEIDFDKELTDDEIRQLLANAKTLADEKGIPDEDFKLDLAGEVDRVVSEALGEVPEDVPEEEPEAEPEPAATQEK